MTVVLGGALVVGPITNPTLADGRRLNAVPPHAQARIERQGSPSHGILLMGRYRLSPAQAWQPWPTGRHHRYYLGGLETAFCYGLERPVCCCARTDHW